MIKKFVFILLFSFFFSACLKTRSQLKDAETERVAQEQVVSLQRTNAEALSKQDELMVSIRKTSGRLDELEHRIEKQELLAKEAKEIQYQERLADQKKIELLTEELENINKRLDALELPAKKPSDSKKTEASSFDDAEALFNDKKWKEAILAYQKYREEKPKGKFYVAATYKLGVAFQELGMKDEAKVFYEEILQRFAKSDYAKKAQYRLSRLK